MEKTLAILTALCMLACLSLAQNSGIGGGGMTAVCDTWTILLPTAYAEMTYRPSSVRVEDRRVELRSDHLDR